MGRAERAARAGRPTAGAGSSADKLSMMANIETVDRTLEAHEALHALRCVADDSPSGLSTLRSA